MGVCVCVVVLSDLVVVEAMYIIEQRNIYFDCISLKDNQ